MKHFATAVLLLLAISVSGIAAVQPSLKKDTVEQLVKSLTEAYTGKTLASLDEGKPYLGNITIVIEHSLGNKKETKTFKTLGKVDEWLKSREKEELPSRQAFTLKQCKKGVCNFTEDGLLHNNLYFKKVTYSYSKGRYYIKTITFLDGD